MAPTKAVRFGALALEAGGGGVSTYIREFLTVVAARLPENHQASAVVSDTAVPELPADVQPVVRSSRRGVARAIQAKSSSGDVDVFHSLDVDLPIGGRGMRVATVHDLSVFDVPWAFSKFRATGEQLLVKDALRRADVIVAVSNFTAERIKDLCGRDSVVTPLAPASWTHRPSPEAVEAIRRKYSLPPRFVLQVGTIEPRKRPNLVAAAARSLGIPCVFAGKGTATKELIGDNIGLGYVPVADLPALYRCATVVAYASVYEGFGLPPLEAMACGATVMASSVGALPEVVGNGAVLVPSNRVADWVVAMRRLVTDGDARAELASRGFDAAAALSWTHTVDLTVAAYGVSRAVV